MHLPNGAQIFIEAGRGAEIAVTAITNAKDPVFTVASAEDLAVGDYILITSTTWGKLADLQLRIKAIAGTSVTVESIDTTSVNQFPLGGTATIVPVNQWIEIPCVQDLAQDGGEQQYYNYQCLADDREQQLPTFKSAVSLTYTFAHEFDNLLYPVLKAADDSGEVKALRMYVPKAREMRMYSGVLSFNDIPQTAMNEMETVSLAVALKGRFISVASNES